MPIGRQKTQVANVSERMESLPNLDIQQSSPSEKDFLILLLCETANIWVHLTPKQT